MELDNANPTIVNPSELPSHRERRKITDDSQKKHGIRQLLLGKSSYAIDPFYLSDYSDTDSDDSGVEPIDEQEIYGEQAANATLLSSSCVFAVTLKFCSYSCVPFHWLEEPLPCHVLFTECQCWDYVAAFQLHIRFSRVYLTTAYPSVLRPLSLIYQN
jgi:hypothetical protein